MVSPAVAKWIAAKVGGAQKRSEGCAPPHRGSDRPILRLQLCEAYQLRPEVVEAAVE